MHFAFSCFATVLLFVAFIIDQTIGCHYEFEATEKCCEQEPAHFIKDGYIPKTTWECPGVTDPDCNIFGAKCAVCLFTLDDTCRVIPHCSCYYCCEEKYGQLCPYGCKNCVYDGDGGCDGHKKDGNMMTALLGGGNFTKMKNSVKESFEKADTDGDGKLTPEESIAFLLMDKKAKNRKTKEELAGDLSWFKKMDKNGNGAIEAKEFDQSL